MPSAPSPAAVARRWSLLSILVLGAGLLGSACGNGDTPAPTSPPTPAPAPPPPAPEPPPTPDGLGITSYGEDSVEWSWNPVEGVDGYEVQISAETAATDDGEIVARTAEQTTYRGEGLESETPYYFQVRSFAGAGEDRLFSAWSEQAMAQIGRFVVPLSLDFEDAPDTDLSELPAELAAKLQAFFDYVTVTAFTGRGLPGAEEPYTFGCSTQELQGRQLEEWLNGGLAFGVAAFEVVLALFAEEPETLDTAIANAQSALDGMLDGLAVNLREESCGLFRVDDVFVWEGEDDVIGITLQAPDGSEEESVGLRVIRVLGTPLTLDPAAAATEASAWWVVRDNTSLGEPAPPLASTLPLRLPLARPAPQQ